MNDDEHNRTLNYLRSQLEYEITVENWDACTEIVGMLGALGIKGIISRVDSPPQNEGAATVAAVSIPEHQFAAFKQLLIKLI